MTTLVEHEKEEKHFSQQHKMHKNLVRFMVVMTAATLLIIIEQYCMSARHI